jgi:hypothetical protein
MNYVDRRKAVWKEDGNRTIHRWGRRRIHWRGEGRGGGWRRHSLASIREIQRREISLALVAVVDGRKEALTWFAAKHQVGSPIHGSAPKNVSNQPADLIMC